MATSTNTVELIIKSSSKGFATGMNKNTAAMAGAEKRSKSLLASMTKMRWTIVNIAMAAAVAYGAFKLFAQPAIELQTEMANVRKTTGLTREEIGGLKKELLSLSTTMPITAVDLAKIAAVAGQLGIKGSDNIRQFTTAIGALSIATGMSAEEAAKNMAKIANAYKLPISSVNELAGAINELENTTAASAEEIIGALTRVGAAASTLGVSFQASLAGVATAIASGMRPQRAGTRMRALFTAMSQDVEKFATIAKMNVSDFSRLMETDMDAALMKAVHGLANINNSTLKMATGYDAAGRVGGFMFLTLSNNAEELEKNLKAVNEQLELGTSHLTEMGIQTETASGQWKILTNYMKEATSDADGMFTEMLRDINEIIHGFGLMKTGADVIAVMRFGPTGLILDDIKDATAEFEKLARAAGVSEERIKKETDIVFDKASAKDRLDAMNDLITAVKEHTLVQAEETKEVDLTSLGWDEAAIALKKFMILRAAVDDKQGKGIETLNADRLALEAFLATIEEQFSLMPKLTGDMEAYYQSQVKVGEATMDNSYRVGKYRDQIKELQRELNKAKCELDRVREAMQRVEERIASISRRRFNIRGISETDIGYLVQQQERELLKARFAALGLGSAEEFLRNATLFSSDAIIEQTEAIQNLSDAAADGEARFKAWQTTLSETIKDLLIHSTDLEKDVTDVVKKAQRELLAISYFDQGGASGQDSFSTMEEHINALRMAQDIFFGEEQDKLQNSLDMHQDRTEGMNKSANQAIKLIDRQRKVMQRLKKEEADWEDEAYKRMKAIDKLKQKIEALTLAQLRYNNALKQSGRDDHGSSGMWTSREPRPTYAKPGDYKIVDSPGYKQPAAQIADPSTYSIVDSPQKIDLNKAAGINININGYTQSPEQLATQIARQIQSLA
ncbi:MAG: phage tail tape measure protein [bacterium]|nr:phage tail tape measure protein [bacterium]